MKSKRGRLKTESKLARKKRRLAGACRPLPAVGTTADLGVAASKPWQLLRPGEVPVKLQVLRLPYLTGCLLSSFQAV